MRKVKLLDDIHEAIVQNINSIKYSQDKRPQVESSLISKADFFKILPPPPENTSKSVYKDLLELSKITKSRTKEQEKFILAVDDKVESAFMPFLNSMNLEFPIEITDVFFRAYVDNINNIKNYYNRARPFQIADRFGIEIDFIDTETIKTPSYPSGHSVYAFLLEKILSEAYPIHAARFERIAESVGHARKMQGVHFNTDIQASKKLVNAIYPRFLKLLDT